jgi:tRNA(Ile)-lysidine synthase
MVRAVRYPKPRNTGGHLIREVIRSLRAQGAALPLNSHILIAASGGSDSMALAHLLANYGRRVAPKSKLKLLHVNHGWRGKESDGDAGFVKAKAKEWGIKAKVVRLKDQPKSGESWEAAARAARKEIYRREAKALGRNTIVLTAHTADDLAETLLWRICTGAFATHSKGILPRHGIEFRPLLNVRKRTLQDYLKEEGETWHEDRTNHEGRFLRSKMRRELMPALEKIFPRAVDHLVDLVRPMGSGRASVKSSAENSNS